MLDRLTQSEQANRGKDDYLPGLAPILRTVIGRRLRDSERQALEAQARARVLSATTLVRGTSA